MAVKNQKFAADGCPELQWSMTGPTVARGFLAVARPKLNQFQFFKLLLVRLNKLDSAYLVTYKPIVDDLGHTVS